MFMNKKWKLISYVLAGALFLGVSGTTFTGCKDYDDDIDSLKEKDSNLESVISALKTQVSTLETALETAQSAASAAQNAAEIAQKAASTAQTAADKAMAEAEAAKSLATSAAATAKAEAIKEAKEYAESLIANLASKGDIEAVVNDLNELSSKVSGIDLALNNLQTSLEKYCTIDALTAAQKALELQIEAVKKYAEKADSDLAAQLKIVLDDLEGRLSALETASANNLTLAQVQKLVGDANTALLKELGIETGTKLSTLFSFISARVSSVTLVPKVFIDGIESIEFQSLKYTPLIFKNGKWIDNSSEAAKILSNGSTQAFYRLNPTGVQETDIEKPSFISNLATTKANGEGENTPIKVDSYTIDQLSGIMTVNTSKTVTSSLELEGNKIWTVALKVPVAQKNLVEGEKEAYVYSEYVRVAEATVAPKIAAKPYNTKVAPHHYSDSTTIFNSQIDANALVTKEVVMDKKTAAASLNLYDLVTGCAMFGDVHRNELTRKELASYGLEFRFAIAKGAYTDVTNQTNQQKFAVISQDSLVIPALPDGETNNFAAADKEPIVRVSLVDTKNGGKIVDVVYLKIKWVKQAMGDQNLGVIGEYDKTLGCEDLRMAISWEDMHTKVYAKLGDLGLSFEEFKQIYPMKIEGDKIINMTITGDGSVKGADSDYPADSYAFVWTLSADDMGAIYPKLAKDYGVTITCEPSISTYPKISFSLEATVVLPELPSINGYYGNYWQTVGELYRITPVHYDPKGAKDQTCVYNNNLMNGFTFYTYADGSKFIVKNIPDCGTWDMQFSMKQSTDGYAPNYTGSEPDKNKENNIGGYNLMKSGVQAAQLVWPDDHVAWCKNPEHKEANIVLEKNDAGKGLIGKTANITVWATINPYNYVPVLSYDVKFVVPLTINASLEGHFVDHKYEGSKVSWAEAFTMTDFANYSVAKQTTNTADEYTKYAAELYKFYEVEDPQWDTENAKISMKWQNGSLVVDNTLTADKCISLKEAYAQYSISLEGNDLVFKNNSGSNVEEECYIYVKVIVKYGWGSAEKWVQIKLLPGDITD